MGIMPSVPIGGLSSAFSTVQVIAPYVFILIMALPLLWLLNYYFTNKGQNPDGHLIASAKKKKADLIRFIDAGNNEHLFLAENAKKDTDSDNPVAYETGRTILIKPEFLTKLPSHRLENGVIVYNFDISHFMPMGTKGANAIESLLDIIRGKYESVSSEKYKPLRWLDESHILFLYFDTPNELEHDCKNIIKQYHDDPTYPEMDATELKDLIVSLKKDAAHIPLKPRVVSIKSAMNKVSKNVSPQTVNALVQAVKKACAPDLAVQEKKRFIYIALTGVIITAPIGLAIIVYILASTLGD